MRDLIRVSSADLKAALTLYSSWVNDKIYDVTSNAMTDTLQTDRSHKFTIGTAPGGGVFSNGVKPSFPDKWMESVIICNIEGKFSGSMYFGLIVDPKNDSGPADVASYLTVCVGVNNSELYIIEADSTSWADREDVVNTPGSADLLTWKAISGVTYSSKNLHTFKIAMGKDTSNSLYTIRVSYYVNGKLITKTDAVVGDYLGTVFEAEGAWHPYFCMISTSAWAQLYRITVM